MRDKVTMQQIADLAGVSKFAVSRSISGKSGVSEETREMILKAAGQLGYFKNEAKSYSNDLKDYNEQRLSGTILVLFPNVRFQNRDSMYWGPVFDGISKQLNQKGMDILTLTEPSSDSMFSLLNPDAIRGIITVGAISTSILLEIHRLKIPMVMVDHQDETFQCDAVFTDNYNAMKQLTTKLVSKGYKRFQFVGHIRYSQSFFERWLAFRETMEQLSIEYSQVSRLISPAAVEEVHLVMEELTDEQIPEVFVCANDTNAVYVIEALQKRGNNVPGDCVVTGFDNTHPSAPILATVDVNKEVLGMRAVDQVVWRILNQESNIEKKLIGARLIIRE